MRLYRLSSLFWMALFAGPWYLWHEKGIPGWLVAVGCLALFLGLCWVVGGRQRS